MEEPPLLSKTDLLPDDSGISLEKPGGLTKKEEQMQQMLCEQHERLLSVIESLKQSGELDDQAADFLLKLEDIAREHDKAARKKKLEGLTPELRLTGNRYDATKESHAKRHHVRLVETLGVNLQKMNGSVSPEVHRIFEGHRKRVIQLISTGSNG